MKKQAKKEQQSVGPNRRTGDRRLVDLGGPPLPVSCTITLTRNEAIEKMVETDIEYFRDMDDSDISDILVDGWKGKPYKKWSNTALEKEINYNFGDFNPEVIYKVRG